MQLSSTQKEVVYGLVLGDAYLQATGKRNARLRLEHSARQRQYMAWIFQQLKNLFARRPTYLERVHPLTENTNAYLRLQSHSSPWFGKLRRSFYAVNGQRRVPPDLKRFLRSGRTLAVWYMDDGYYYARDKSAHLYLPKYSEAELARLTTVIKERFGITAKVYCRPDRNACHLTINGADLSVLAARVKPFIIPSMRYKLPPDPVTTESEKTGRF